MSNNSIEITGQQNYHFQDMVCVYLIIIILSKYPDVSNSFRSEQADSEDATIIIDGRTIEVQVKGAKEAFSLKNLADYLAHFPDRSSDNCLFQRLLSDDRFVIFIVSARCKDETSKYNTNLQQGIKAHDKEFLVKDVTDLYEFFTTWSTGTGKETVLMSSRDTTVHSLPTTFTKNQTKEALKRLLVVESFTTETVTNQCEELLRNDFSIPNHKHANLITELVTIVKDGKRQESLLPECTKTISSFQPNPLAPKNYIANGNEDKLYNILCDEDALIITGQPRIGKTYTAKFIASKFQVDGYAVEVINDVNEAELLMKKSHDLIILLDDPLGSITANPNANQELTKLQVMLQDVSSSKKLLISQREDILLEVSSCKSINKLRFNHRQCYQLIINEDFSVSLWQKLAEEYQVDKNTVNTVSEYLSSKVLVLEAGCIEYLAVNNLEIKHDSDIADINVIAHKNAMDLSKELESQGFKETLQTLFITTNLNIPVEIYHYKNILNINDENLLSISSQNSTCMTFGDFEHVSNESKVIKKYKFDSELNDKQTGDINLLIEKRIIECENNKLNFTHSFYRNSAECLISQNSIFIGKLFKLVRQSILSLSSTTSKATASNLNIIYKLLSRENHKNDLIEISIQALKSSYPATRDISFKFLIENLDSIPESIPKEIEKWISQVGFFSLDDVAWIEGEPVFSMDNDLSIEKHWADSFKKVDINIDNPFLSERFVTTEEAWNFICSLELREHELTKENMEYLLSFTEGSLRAKATKVWLSIPRNDDNEILSFIFDDVHPAVSNMIIESIFHHWEAYDDERQNQFIDGVKESSKNKINAIVMFKKLVKEFSHDEYSTTNNTNPLKLLELFSNLMDNVPEYVYIESVNLYCAIYHNYEGLEETKQLSIFSSWTRWLEAKCKFSLPDDYELGITSLITSVSSSQQRCDIIQRLLGLHGTGAKVRVISDLVKIWNCLSETEKSLVIQQVHTSRQDKNWLISAILVQDSIPDELIEEFLPDSITADSFLQLETINPNLFECAIKMYLGYQPLFYLGHHHKGTSYWQSSLEKIAVTPTHSLFKSVLEDFLTFRCNDLDCLIQRSDSKYLDGFFTIYFDLLCTTNFALLPKLIEQLFSLAPDPLKSVWFEKLALNANLIFNRWDEVEFLFTNADFRNEFFSHANVKYDMNILKLCSYCVKPKDEYSFDNSKTIKKMLSLTEGLITEKSLSHHNTCCLLAIQLKELGASEDFLSKIDDMRIKLIDESHSLIYSKNAITESDDWIF